MFAAMRQLLCFVGSILAFTLISACASAPKPLWDRDPVFLSKDALAIGSALPPPPEPKSKADAADFQELEDLQGHRTMQDCERATSEVQVSLESFFGPKYGPLTESEVAKWNQFMTDVRIDTDYFVQRVKKQWKRPRPYVSDPQLTPCIRREQTSAYPSGHAAIARVLSRVLVEIDPKRKGAFEKRAEVVARDRVLGGVHHPSDIEAGEKLGDEVFALLQKNEHFRKDLAALPR
jgi:acid phosphatase (class A)